MPNPKAVDFLGRAKKHLEKVLDAWDTPTDWGDLTIYGFYCLEAAVMAVAAEDGTPVAKNHPAKASAAQTLASKHSLPDISGLLTQLNIARKAEAYGDCPMPSLVAEDVARVVEEYVSAVEAYVKP